MGRHRAPDPDEPTDEPSDDYSEPDDFGDVGDYRESDDFPAAEPPSIDAFSGPRYPDHPADDYASGFPSDSGYFDYTDPLHRDEHLRGAAAPRRHRYAGRLP